MRRLDPTPFAILQTAHVAISVAVVLMLVVLVGLTALAACYFTILAALLKEFVWDWLTETTSFVEECMDFAFYALGALAIAGVLWVRGIGR